MKYIIELNPDYVDGEFLRLPIRAAGEFQWIKTKASLTPYIEPDRKAIEDEVWSMVKDIALNMTRDDYRAYFGVNDAESIFKLCGCLEAIDKYEAWKKQKNEILVGDEITLVDDDVIAVMLDCAGCESIYVMTENGCVERWKGLDGVKKTGRHFPEVAELLEKMREAKEC